MAVSLAMMGARGKTADEMLSGLKLSGTNEKISDEIHALMRQIRKNPTLHVANRVYVMKNCRINAEFDAIARVYAIKEKSSHLGSV